MTAEYKTTLAPLTNGSEEQNRVLAKAKAKKP